MWLYYLVLNFLMLNVGSSFPTTNRVVNGTDADFGEFPFVVSIRESITGEHLCGSTILNSQWLLTAAHCVASFEINPRWLEIQHGVTKISTQGPNIINVTSLIIHEDYYEWKSFRNDIALVKLETPIEFDKFSKPTKLPKSGIEIEGGTVATLVGWGRNATIDGTMQNHLQKAKLETFTNERCAEIHSAAIFETHLCAGVPEGGKGQCNGDSGGPLFVDEEQVGIVSWSIKPCAITPYPGVYTKVSHYVNWINKHI